MGDRCIRWLRAGTEDTGDEVGIGCRKPALPLEPAARRVAEAGLRRPSRQYHPDPMLNGSSSSAMDSVKAFTAALLAV